MSPTCNDNAVDATDNNYHSNQHEEQSPKNLYRIACGCSQIQCRADEQQNQTANQRAHEATFAPALLVLLILLPLLVFFGFLFCFFIPPVRWSSGRRRGRCDRCGFEWSSTFRAEAHFLIDLAATLWTIRHTFHKQWYLRAEYIKYAHLIAENVKYVHELSIQTRGYHVESRFKT